MNGASLRALVPVLALCASAVPSLAAGPPSDLEVRLRAIAAESGGALGVKVVHLESGRSAGLDERGRYPMASAYKLAIALAFLAEVDAVKRTLDDEVEVRPGELRRTGSRVDPWTPGSPVAVGQLLERMLTESDNTGCDVLLRLLGGPRAVDAWLASKGFPEVDVSWTEMEMAAVESGVAPVPAPGTCDHACLDALVAKVPKARREEAERAFEGDARNTASPADLARLLVALRKGELLSPKSTGTVLGTMARNRTGDRRIRALLPKGTPVQDKTGTIGRSAIDVGLVGLPAGKGTLAVAVFVKGSTKGFDARERAIAEAAKAAFEAFAR